MENVFVEIKIFSNLRTEFEKYTVSFYTELQSIIYNYILSLNLTDSKSYNYNVYHIDEELQIKKCDCYYVYHLSNDTNKLYIDIKKNDILNYEK